MRQNTRERIAATCVAAPGFIATESRADVTFFQFDQARFRILGYADADGNTLPE